jgi:hypothetical protein
MLMTCSVNANLWQSPSVPAITKQCSWSKYSHNIVRVVVRRCLQLGSALFIIRYDDYKVFMKHG